MKSIAFFNNKGGVGKTTLLCNVAAYASLHLGMKVCVIDADPQCNATQYFFNEDVLDQIYSDAGFTILDVVEPLTQGEGFSQEIRTVRSDNFGFDVLPGDPKLALTEDFLAQDWGDAKSGNVRGIRTNLVFSDLLGRLHNYDLVFIDVSPSLGAINRSILLSSDYFMSPMSIDIFSLKAFENIAEWIADWSSDWDVAIQNVKDSSKLPSLNYGQAKFLGYVTQQYLAKKDSSGRRRGVRAYEEIRGKIDNVIADCGLDEGIPGQPFEIGTVPNLFSLIPMSQSNNKPVFELLAKDGVVGAHFAKVKDAKAIFGSVTRNLLGRLNG
ncbi:ParA family protein [Sulfitobacter geojensis]|uniref:ParA family protein n=1 Tax=Sulfitobacter geojensis TaxID=1342299 RepID=UPI0036D9AEF6